eukprot:c16742_g1_i1.p1 GENE.c16742_g1_i1~~c16742_g1_i1.p1  ORF type:complete len:191 (+),score=41.59 c16742_g1_i1:299-871(+)
MYLAALEDYVEVIKLLHRLGSNVNSFDELGYTPVHAAAGQGHTKAITILHTLGAKIDTPNNDGQTPLFVAAEEGHVEVIRVLRALGANINTPDQFGTTPLMAAVEEGEREVVLVLIQLGAAMFRRRKDGKRAADLIDTSGLDIGPIIKQELRQRLRTFLMGTLRRGRGVSSVLLLPVDVLGLVAQKVMRN